MESGMPPEEAIRARSAMEELLGSSVAGVYLYGSAVAGGLRGDSDVDIMAVVNRRLSGVERVKLTDRLLQISGKMGNKAVRSLEVTVVNRGDVVPWRYPPRKEYAYGEWLREEIEAGHIPVPEDDPDLAILLYQVSQSSLCLAGRAAPEILEPVPMADVRSAMRDSLPGLIGCTRGDERNVILTLARMWVTAADGRILPKDEAAEWAAPRLPEQRAALLAMAGKAYRGECADRWEGLDADVDALVAHMRREISRCLAGGAESG